MKAPEAITALVLACLLGLGTISAQERHPQGNMRPQQGQWRSYGGGNARRSGDWLREHMSQSPAERERALENDTRFRNLPAQRQEQLREQLQRFNNRPPQQQQQILHRMNVWENLSPEQKQSARAAWGQFRELPPDRKAALRQGFRGLQGLSPVERQRLLNSPAYRSMYSEQERNVMRNMPDVNAGSANQVPRPH